MSIIESIEKLDDDFELGYLVKTTGDGEIKVIIDNYPLSCEVYYANAMHKNHNVDTRLKDWNGQKITNVVISPKKGRIYEHEEDKNDNDNDEGYLDEEDEEDIDARYRTVSIYTENDESPLVIYLYNSHNGFYPHRCLIVMKNIQGVSMSNTSLSFRL